MVYASHIVLGSSPLSMSRYTEVEAVTLSIDSVDSVTASELRTFQDATASARAPRVASPSVATPWLQQIARHTHKTLVAHSHASVMPPQFPRAWEATWAALAPRKHIDAAVHFPGRVAAGEACARLMDEAIHEYKPAVARRVYATCLPSQSTNPLLLAIMAKAAYVAPPVKRMRCRLTPATVSIVDRQFHEAARWLMLAKQVHQAAGSHPGAIQEVDAALQRLVSRKDVEEQHQARAERLFHGKQLVSADSKLSPIIFVYVAVQGGARHAVTCCSLRGTHGFSVTTPSFPWYAQDSLLQARCTNDKAPIVVVSPRGAWSDLISSPQWATANPDGSSWLTHVATEDLVEGSALYSRFNESSPFGGDQWSSPTSDWHASIERWFALNALYEVGLLHHNTPA